MGRWAAFLISAIMAVLVALPSRTGAWIRDDLVYVVNNPQVVGGTPLAEAFTTPFAPSTGEPLGLYRPVTTVSLALDARLGSESPTAFHTTNLILAGLIAATAAGLLMAIGLHPALACAAALVYAVHPGRTEAVNWISGRAELLMTWFSLLALWVGAKGGTVRALFSASLAVLALYSKEQGAVLLVLLPLLPDLSRRARLTHLVVTGAFFAGALAWRFHVVGGLGPEGPMQVLNGVGLGDRSLFGLRFLADYVMKVVMPLPLINEYDDPTLPVGWAWLAGGLAVLVTALVALKSVLVTREVGRSSSRISFGWLVFVIPLLPVLNVVYRTGETFAERFLTLPLAGAACAVACLLELLWKSSARAAWLMVGLALPLSVLSYQRSAQWMSADTLFEAQIREAPNVGGGYQVLAAALIDREGDGAGSTASVDRIPALLKEAVDRSPSRVQAVLAYARLCLRRAGSETDPTARSRSLLEAERFFRLTLEKDSSLRTARGGLALVLALQGMDTGAEEMWKEELRLHPREFRSALNYANFLRERSRETDARAVLERARTAVREDLDGMGADALSRGSMARNEALRVAAEIDTSLGHTKGAIAALEEAVVEAPDPETRIRTVFELVRNLEADQGREASLRAIERVRNGFRDELDRGVPTSARLGLLMALADAEAALGAHDEARKALEAARLLAHGLRKSKIERALANLPATPKNP